ncbi:MAG: hypothetical protein V2I33_19030 [Kangiellaceae bacterium]|nr:hypothetical protein [Kangiellaceae bacterium]
MQVQVLSAKSLFSLQELHAFALFDAEQVLQVLWQLSCVQTVSPVFRSNPKLQVQAAGATAVAPSALS